MGELIRRLDYQRRTKKSLMVDTGSGQRINKEYSPQVRAANEMEDRKKTIMIEDMEKHKRLFLNRFNYDKKVMLRFKEDLDAKSVDFNEFKFQQLRAQSARGRMQGNLDTDIGPVTEIIPRHYYRGESKIAVKFQVDSSNNSDISKSNESLGSDESVFQKKEIETDHLRQKDKHVSEKPNNTDAKSVVKTLNSWANLTKKPPSNVLRRRRMSLAVDSNRFIPARDVRRQSAPPKVMSAFQPRDIRSAPLSSRRDSRSSISSAENFIVENENETAGRSFRILREAFKKKKVEVINTKQEKLNNIRADHFSRTTDLHEKTLERFDELFAEHVFPIFY